MSCGKNFYRWLAIFSWLLVATLPNAVRAEKKSAPLANYYASPSTPPWVSDLPIPKNESIFLVVKGLFPTKVQADDLKHFIQQLMVKTPGDGVDVSDHYQGLPSGRYVVGMLFDTRERALWWMDYSYRNRKISRGFVREVKVVKDSTLPYMPSASRPRPKPLVSEDDAMAKVKALPDLQRMAAAKKLRYRFTDYPRNGDLRYEIEVMEDRGRLDPVMVDFVMVSALNGQVVERLSEAMGQKVK